MADIPNRTKIMLIALVIIGGYAIYDIVLSGGDGQEGSGQQQEESQFAEEDTPDTPGNELPDDQPGGGMPALTRSRINLQLKDDPFFRIPAPTLIASDSQQVGPLDGLEYNGTAGDLVVINQIIYKVGDTINGYGLTIVEIRLDEVVLVDDSGKRYILR